MDLPGLTWVTAERRGMSKDGARMENTHFAGRADALVWLKEQVCGDEKPVWGTSGASQPKYSRGLCPEDRRDPGQVLRVRVRVGVGQEAWTGVTERWSHQDRRLLWPHTAGGSWGEQLGHWGWGGQPSQEVPCPSSGPLGSQAQGSG